MCGDILFHLGYDETTKKVREGFEPTQENKEILHDFHKRVLGYSTISGRKEEVVSRFLQEVVIFWSVEQGIFVRTSKKQPLWIERLGFSDIVTIDGKDYQVRDLL